MADCACYACVAAEVAASPQLDEALGIDMRMARMFICPQCGNKRCPRAASHENACSDSNLPGQAGSLYE